MIKVTQNVVIHSNEKYLVVYNQFLPCNIDRYAVSVMAKTCGGSSCLFIPLYLSIIFSVYIGSLWYGLTTTQKSPEYVWKEEVITFIYEIIKRNNWTLTPINLHFDEIY